MSSGGEEKERVVGSGRGEDDKPLALNRDEELSVEGSSYALCHSEVFPLPL